MLREVGERVQPCKCQSLSAYNSLSLFSDLFALASEAPLAHSEVRR